MCIYIYVCLSIRPTILLRYNGNIVGMSTCSGADQTLRYLFFRQIRSMVLMRTEVVI